MDAKSLLVVDEKEPSAETRRAPSFQQNGPHSRSAAPRSHPCALGRSAAARVRIDHQSLEECGEQITSNVVGNPRIELVRVLEQVQVGQYCCGHFLAERCEGGVIAFLSLRTEAASSPRNIPASMDWRHSAGRRSGQSSVRLGSHPGWSTPFLLRSPVGSSRRSLRDDGRRGSNRQFRSRGNALAVPSPPDRGEQKYALERCVRAESLQLLAVRMDRLATVFALTAHRITAMSRGNILPTICAHLVADVIPWSIVLS